MKAYEHNGTTASSITIYPPVAPTLMPSIPFSTHLALTVVFTTMFSLLFLFVYVQLWMILYYGHKRRSYQTVFLFLCLIWAGLRLSLFTFYYKQQSLFAVNDIHPAFYWVLYSFPVVLQFTTLVLLVSFFSQVVIKARYPQDVTKYKKWVKYLCGISVIIFTAVNTTCGIIYQHYKKHPSDSSFIALTVRVVVNGLLFVAHGVALSYWIFSLNRIANARALLESKGKNMCQSCLACMFIVFLYASRAIYNMLAVFLHKFLPSLGYGILNVTDQADFVNLYEGYNYIIYGIVLFLWEILPTFIVTVFFRVQKPTNAPVTLDEVSQRSYRQQGVFDNPSGRYAAYDDQVNGYSGSYNSSRYSTSQEVKRGATDRLARKLHDIKAKKFG